MAVFDSILLHLVSLASPDGKWQALKQEIVNTLCAPHRTACYHAPFSAIASPSQAPSAVHSKYSQH
eukprot:71962-Pleurochrysis_carterae.AAC.1